MKTFHILLSALTVLCGASLAFADGMIIIGPHPRPVPVPPHHYPFAPLEVLNHHVKVKITDQVAVTEVDQTFYNPNDQVLEGTYVFPIPAGAKIDKFSMDIDGKMQEAELLDADKARKVYEDIVRSMRDPALMEYIGQGLFRVRVFPIEAKGKKQIRLQYTEVLKSDSGLVHYLYPLNTEKFSATPVKSVSVKCSIETKRPLKAVYSPSHNVDVKRSDDELKATVGFEVSDQKPDTDFSLYFSTSGSGGGPEGGAVGLSLLTFNDGLNSPGATAGGTPAPPNSGYFMLLASPGAASAQVIKKDVVFVVDTSGSMTGDKMEQARKALQFCVDSLNEGDRFQIIRFSTETENLFDGLVAAAKDHRDKAGTFIKALKAGGGTAIDDALREAAACLNKGAITEGRPRTVIFLTDGRPTIGETNEDTILGDWGKAEAKFAPGAGDAAVGPSFKPAPIRVFCFGIGNDLNTHLLDKITEATRAASQYVLPTEDIEVKVSSFYAKINNPVLADLKLTVAGADAAATGFAAVKISGFYPAPLPDLFKGDQLVLMGRYTLEGAADAPATLVLSGTIDGKLQQLTLPTVFPAKNTANDFLPKLWAVRRVGYLLDQIRLHGESAELKDEVTQLARQYAIVTPYTAYLILEDEDRRRVPMEHRMMRGVADAAPGARAEISAKGGLYGSERGGAGGVGGAQANQALKEAENLAAPAAAGQTAQHGWDQSKDAREAGKLLTQSQQNTRFARNRTFYQNGEAWVDSQVQAQPQAKRQQVKFNSTEYFDLMKKGPDVAQWLSLGKNVQFVLGDTIYEVVEGG